MNRRRFLASLTSGTLALRLSAVAETKPNIVLIYADDVGYGDLSCYGATSVRTPNLDRLAGAGVRFTNAHATSATCTPSRYSLLTASTHGASVGQACCPATRTSSSSRTAERFLRCFGMRATAPPWSESGTSGMGKGKVDWNGEISPARWKSASIIPSSCRRPATACRACTSRTAASSGWIRRIRSESITEKLIGDEPTGKRNPENAEDAARATGTTWPSSTASPHRLHDGGKSALWVDEDMADTFAKKATAFIEQNKSRPFFLYFATHDIHVPRAAEQAFRRHDSMGPRGDAIAELDWTVGQVLDALDRNGLTPNTLVIFSSDNGPVVDDGYRTTPLRSSAATVPRARCAAGSTASSTAERASRCLSRWPGRIPADRVSNALVSQVDFYSSLGAIAGAKTAVGGGADSMEQSAALTGRDQKGRDWLVEHAGTLTLIQDKWKLIPPNKGAKVQVNTNTETGNDPEPQLYDLSKDIGERNNVAAQYPDRVKAMMEQLAKVRGAEPRP